MSTRNTIKNELNELERKTNEMSIAYMSIKSANKSKTFWFTAWIITFLCFLGALIFIVNLLSDISTTVTDTIDIQEVQNIDNSHIKIGDDVWEKLN